MPKQQLNLSDYSDKITHFIVKNKSTGNITDDLLKNPSTQLIKSLTSEVLQRKSYKSWKEEASQIKGYLRQFKSLISDDSFQQKY